MATQELNAISDRIISRLAENLFLPLWEVDSQWVNKIISTEMKDKQVYAIFVSGEGNILAGKMRDADWQPVDAVNDIETDEYIVRDADILRDDELIGNAKIYITREFMKAQFKDEAIRTAFITLAIVIFIIIFLVLMLNKIIIGPLAQLVNVVKAVSKGEYSHNVQFSQHDEIGMLGNEFNDMQKNILLREKDLQDSQAQVHLLLDSTAEAIYGIDTMGVCTFVNQACVDMLGYKKDSELLGKNMHTLIHYCYPDGSSYPVEKCHIFRAFANQTETHVDNEVLWRKDGSAFAAEYWSHPIFKENKCIGAVVTFLNITDRIEAHKTLKEREQDLEITLNSIGDAVIATDTDGRITRMNPVAEKLTGWSFNDAQGKSVKAIFPIFNASTRKPISNPIEKVMATGETIHLSDHTTLVAKDGTEYHIADSAAPIRNGDDIIQGMVLIFNDVSEQYRLREEVRLNELLMHGLMDDLKSMVGIMNPDGRIAFINNMPLELANISRDEVIGQTLWSCEWFNTNSEVIKRLEEECLQIVAQKSIAIWDIEFKGENNFIWMELGIYPVLDDDDKVIQMVFEGVDITQRKEAEVLQKNYQLKLEQKVYERTAELEHKAAELQRATRLKSEFLANMSHELRTPMNSIIGFTGRVIKKASNQLDPRQLNNLHTVERNAHHLLGLINGLLDLSKIEAGKMEAHAEYFYFSILAKEVFSLTQAMLENKPIEFKVDIPSADIQLHTDNTKLKQVLINLVSNAIKFTHDGSITIEAKLLSGETKPQIAIRVIDTGVGMDKDALQYIFEAFRQVDGTLTRKTGGTGLGLAIVRSFTELLMGTVTVESETGVGTAFEIIIPVNLEGIVTSSATPQPSLPQAQKYGEKKQTVLCIDDETEVLELLSGYLSDEGYQAITALNGEDGLALAKQQQPFAITLDILMPHKDGWSVLSELKSNEKTCDIPVIIISFLDNKTLGYQLGAFDYMQKPINPQHLIASIQHLSQDNIRNVLVVDDDIDARNLMRQILDDANITCDVAVDGTTALSYLQQAGEKLPGLIFLDLMMPGMDGFELLQKLQQNPAWAAIPVIIVTAKNLADHERDFLQPRVASILAKEGLSSEQVLKQLGAAVNRLKK